MSLVIPFDPAGLEPKVVGAIDEIIATVQTWAGKSDAWGRWVSPTLQTGALRIDGTGNAWNVTGSAAVARTHYTIIGDTMLLNFYVVNTALTVAAATNTAYVRIPDGYVVGGKNVSGSLVEGRAHYSNGFYINNGTSGALLFVGNAASPWIAVQTLSGSNFVTSSDMTVLGQIALEVKQQ